MVKMAMKDVCRLCLTADDLVWIFDKRFENTDSMRDVVYITTGVEITMKDIISQKICKKCCQVTIKMFEFRRTSLKNDKHLREQCNMLLKDIEIKIPNTEVTIRSEGKKDPNISGNIEKKTGSNEDVVEQKQESRPLYTVHPSVRDLFKVYPQIKLPTVCLRYNISPCVAMTMDQVEQHFKSRNLDFQKYTKLALKTGKVATKRTSSIAKAPRSNATQKAKSERKDKAPKKESNKKTESKNSNHSKKIKLAPQPGIEGRDEVINKIIQNTLAEIKLQSAMRSTTVQNDPKIDPVEEHVPVNKRKFSEVDSDEKNEFKKNNFVESLGLAPKPDDSMATDPSGGVLSFVTNKSMPVHICEICNAVEYNARDLKRHQNRHMRCQLCKRKFRSLESKEEHLDSMCPIKNMMNNMPDVVLQRIEFNEDVVRKYLKAFQDYPQFQSLVTENNLVKEENINISATKLVDSKHFDDSVESKCDIPKETATTRPSEVIEILSDDDEQSNRLLPSSALGPCTSQAQAVQQFALPENTNVVYNTVSIVRPDIKIKGSNALDLIDARLTDIKVLKDLLTHYRPVILFGEKNVQTELPANDSVVVNQTDLSAEMKQLKPQLHVYKIPVVMKNGLFDVCFNYDMDSKPPKKLCLWNDLIPINVKPPKLVRPVEVPAPQNKTILPSTATYNSPGIVSVSPQGAIPTTSKFIRVNTSSLSPITATPPANLVSTNPMLNNFLESPATSVSQTTVNATATVQSSNIDAPVLNTGQQQLGVIRVKNVWELI